MSEKFQINNPEPMENSELDRSPENGQEFRRNGIFAKFDSFARKHPNLMALCFILEVSVLGEKAEDGLKIISDLNIPTRVHGVKVETQTTPDDDRLVKELETDVKSYTVKWILETDSVKTPEERDEVLALPDVNRVYGFDKFVLSNETISGILEQTLPKGFNRNLNSIGYVNSHTSMPNNYTSGLYDGSEEAAHANGYNRTIEVVKGAELSSKEWIVNKMLPHEMFHLQDWDSNLLLTQSERLELYKNIIDRVKSDDRFKSEYVEGINNDDKKTELSVKAAEYFAEIGAAYLSTDYSLLPQADKDLIRDFIAKVDPSFDRKKALKHRYKLIGEGPSVMQVTPLEEVLEKERKSSEDYLAGAEEKLRVRIKEANPSLPDFELDTIIEKWKTDEINRAERSAKSWYETMLKINKESIQEYEDKFK